jgi:hypothetical protein
MYGQSRFDQNIAPDLCSTILLPKTANRHPLTLGTHRSSAEPIFRGTDATILRGWLNRANLHVIRLVVVYKKSLEDNANAQCHALWPVGVKYGLTDAMPGLQSPLDAS